MKKIYLCALMFLIAAAPLTLKSGEFDKLSAAEKEKLKKGEIIYQSVKTTDTDGKISGYGQSMALIKKPVATCWEIFTQFDKQAEYFPRKTVSQVIDSKPGLALVQKEFKFYWVTIRYVMKYKIDAKNYRIDFEIDKSRPHDIKDSAGFFRFEPLSAGETLFIYGVTRVDTGLAMPGFVQEYLQKKDLPAVAENVQKRIESNGTWKKDD